MKIKLLDASVSNKIAAGEVVERPSSIVKELCENSIDAGATSVTVEIKGGGIDCIRITDNGCGMEEDDVKTAFLRHATSKISVAEDLNNILTLGFRGEALASIASVSKVKLLTRTKNSLEGTEINLNGGEIEKFTSCGCPEGTAIWVEDLFFNTPARRKFLKRPSQEASYINDVVNRLALSHPEVAVKFISDSKTVLRTPGDGLLSSCIRGVYGADTAANIIPIDISNRGITLSGFLGNREIQKSNRSWQVLFINGRSVKNDIVSAAVYQGYAGRLNVGKFPFFVLNMSLAGNMVDVNVHPTKQEVRFADGLPVFDVVFSAVSETLSKNQEIPTLFKEHKTLQGATVQVVQPNTDKNFASGNSASGNSISGDSASGNSASGNSAFGNTAFGGNASGNKEDASFKNPYQPISAEEFRKSISEKDKYKDDLKKPLVTEIRVTSPTRDSPALQNNAAQNNATQKVASQSSTTQNGAFAYPTPQPRANYIAADMDKEVRDFANFLKGAVSGMSDAPMGAITPQKTVDNNTSVAENENSASVQDNFVTDNGKNASVKDNFVTDNGKNSSVQDNFDKNNGKNSSAQDNFNKNDGKNSSVQDNIASESEKSAFGEHLQGSFVAQEYPLQVEYKPDYKVIGILFDTYIIIEFEESAYIIDQHAAHERILFERLYASCGENSASQIMMIPRIIKVSPSEQAILEDLIPQLTELGYEIDLIGIGSFAVKATPSALDDTDSEKFITSLLTESNSIKILRTNELKRNKLMQLACKSAVKAGDKLSDSDIRVLLELIVKENVPLSCPHGRPILIKLSKHELEVRFKRIQ